MKIKAIVSDIGGVILEEDNMKTHYGPLIGFMKLDKKKFFIAYKKYVGKASRGKMTAKKMICLIARDLGVDEPALLRNWIKFKKKSIKMNNSLEKFYLRLKKRGYRLVSMSGVLDLHYNLLKEKGIYDIFEINICSFKAGCNKPDMKIYKLLIKKLKVSPGEIVFIDDAEECLPPAKKLGIKTILFRNNKQLKRELLSILK